MEDKIINKNDLCFLHDCTVRETDAKEQYGATVQYIDADLRSETINVIMQWCSSIQSAVTCSLTSYSREHIVYKQIHQPGKIPDSTICHLQQYYCIDLNNGT